MARKMERKTKPRMLRKRGKKHYSKLTLADHRGTGASEWLTTPGGGEDGREISRHREGASARLYSRRSTAGDAARRRG
jgi:hypothetical protein